MDERTTELQRVVRAIPPGTVTTYGAVARVLATTPRAAGRLMAVHGSGLPWWRVVNAAGHPPPHGRAAALEQYLAEGTPLRSRDADTVRVDMAAATWWELR